MVVYFYQVVKQLLIQITKYKSEYFIFSYSKKISFLKPFIVTIWSMV